MSSPGQQRSRAPAGAEVGETLRDMWATRPARRRDDRKIAGVCAAVARRYAIDPTLVRVGFVVGAFYGVGLLVYLVGFLVLPRLDDQGRRREPSVAAIVVAVVLMMISIAAAVGGSAGTVIGVLVTVALLYALHRSRGGVVGAAPPPAAVAPQDGDDERSGPPTWDPLGAAPFAWDLPSPSAPAPPPPPRSRVVPVTLAVAVLAAGLVAGLGLLGLLPLGATAIVGTALAVVGAGLVVGAFLHRGRGLLIAAVPLALVLVGAANASTGPWNDGDRRGGPPWASDRDGTSVAGDSLWSPPPGAVAPIYQTAYGDAVLDLRNQPAGRPITTTARSGAGDVSVLVPATADVTVTCESGGGSVDCLGRVGDGRTGPITDLGPDGPGGPVITVAAASGAGDVEVRRG